MPKETTINPMQAYIAISYHKMASLAGPLQAIKVILHQHSITPFVFAEVYQYHPDQEKEMMEQAFSCIDKSDFLIAETSDKAIGIGIEVGYAKAKGKPIIYLRQQAAEHSTTVSGTSNFPIIYNDEHDLKHQLKNLLEKIKPLANP